MKYNSTKRHVVYILPVLAFFIARCMISCNTPMPAKDHPEGPDPATQTQAFKDYWYAGKAELNHYNMNQIRYGEIHNGDAIMVFVTEDFLSDKQVKLESPRKGRDITKVMKFNLLKEFVTGIYKYNVMTSTFAPVNNRRYPHALKIAFTSQDWCGTVFSQLNLRGGEYKITGHSYFERQADYETSLDATWATDELWTQIRLAPDRLPQGEINIIPASFAVRRSHKGWSVEKAVAKKETWTGEGMPGKNLIAYSIRYKNIDYRLTIIYEKDFPHRIAGWIQTEKTKGDKKLEARSVRTNSIEEPYWRQHNNADTTLRKKLDLKP